MTYRLRNILLAVVLAVLAAFMTALYVASYQKRVDRGQEKVKVFIAKTDIAPGTPASALAGKLTEKEIPRKSLVPTAVFNLRDVDGQTTSQWIYGGEQVTARRFAAAGQAGIRIDLKGNLRAVQISGNAPQLLAGIIKQGDHVDFGANLKIGDDKHAARTVLRDLLVLKAPQSAGIDSKVTDPTSSSYNVVLQLTDAQANKLLFVTTNQDHEWSLELRPVADAADSPESLATLPKVLNDGLPGNAGRNR
jgi:Flp pilus assembly protein CpaB